MLSGIERRVEDGEPRRGGLRRVEAFALHALHAAGIASEEQADFVVGAVALVNAHLLPLAAREVDQLAGHRQPAGLLEQRTDLAAQRTARHIRPAEGILDHGIVASADLQRALAGADVEAGFTEHFAFEDQLPDQFQLGLGGVCAHALLVVGHDGLK